MSNFTVKAAHKGHIDVFSPRSSLLVHFLFLKRQKKTRILYLFARLSNQLCDRSSSGFTARRYAILNPARAFYTIMLNAIGLHAKSPIDEKVELKKHSLSRGPITSSDKQRYFIKLALYCRSRRR